MSQTHNTAMAVIGIDIGKNSFHVVGQDARGAIVLRQKVVAWPSGSAARQYTAAIAEAVQRPTMKFVATKTVEQLDLQALHRVRQRLVSQRTGIINQIRAFMLQASDPLDPRAVLDAVKARPGNAGASCKPGATAGLDRPSARRNRRSASRDEGTPVARAKELRDIRSKR